MASAGKNAGTAGGPGAVRRIQRDLIVLAASLAVFAGCAVVASDGRAGPAERAVFHAVNGLPGWLYQPMLAAQYLGVLAMPLVVAAFALVWRRWRLAAALVLVVPLKLVLERVAKQLVQRQRPGTTVPGAILRGVPHHGLSFTSGHSRVRNSLLRQHHRGLPERRLLPRRIEHGHLAHIFAGGQLLQRES